MRTSYGLHLIKLSSIKAPVAAPTAARAKVESEIKARKAEERFFEFSEKFRNLVYEQPDSLKPAAELLGLKIETSAWFTRTGGESGLLANTRIVEAAFDPEVLGQGRNSPVIDNGPNILVALRIAGHEPPRLRPLAEVRAEIEKKLLASALQAEAERVAQEILTRLRAGGSLEAVSKQYGLEAQKARVYGRKTAGVDAALLTALFQAAHPMGGRPVYGNTPQADGAVAVFALKQVIESDKPVMTGAEAESLRRTLESRRGQEHLKNYRNGLRQDAKIKIYKDQI